MSLGNTRTHYAVGDGYDYADVALVKQKIPIFFSASLTQIWVTRLWEALDAKRLTPGQVLDWFWVP